MGVTYAIMSFFEYLCASKLDSNEEIYHRMNSGKASLPPNHNRNEIFVEWKLPL